MRSMERCETLSKTQILPQRMRNQHHGVMLWTCWYAVKWTLNAIRPLPRSNVYDICSDCDLNSMWLQQKWRKVTFIWNHENQHNGIKFWRRLYPCKWTLNALRLLPRSPSIDFMKILRCSQNWRQRLTKTALETSSNVEFEKNEGQIWNQQPFGVINAHIRINACGNKMILPGNYYKWTSWIRVLHMSICSKKRRWIQWNCSPNLIRSIS